MPERPQQHQLPPDTVGGGPSSGSGTPAPEPSDAERSRTLVASASRGCLSTLAREPDGHPFGSVVSYALDDPGNPLLFVSLMAEHTQNAIRDPRSSLLVTEPVPDGADPLASGRVTLLGTMAAVSDRDRPEARRRYLAANPASSYYIDFGDFAFYRLDVAGIRYVGGYGRMSWVDVAAYASAAPDPLAAASAGIIEHMNSDHAEAQALLCRQLGGLADVTAATMSAVDRYGFEMIAVGPAGPAPVRLGFPAPCDDVEAVRTAVVDMVKEARGLRR